MNSVPELRERELQQPNPTSKLHINQLDGNLHKTETKEEPIKTETDSVPKPVESVVVVDEIPKEPTVDPIILKYRKMLQFGVPRGAVELKMVNEGLDPKLL